MKSEYMGILNKARAAVRNGKLEKGRFNRAFGLLQSNDFTMTVDKYNTTLASCDCPDSKTRKTICKHRITMMVIYRSDIEHYRIMVAERKIRSWNNHYYVVNQELRGWRTHVFTSKNEAIKFTRLTTTIAPAAGKGSRLPDVYGV